MPRTIHIRNVDDAIYRRLAQRATEVGLTVPEFLRREITRLAARPSMEEWLARTRRRSCTIEHAEVLAALDESRGPWPDADR